MSLGPLYVLLREVSVQVFCPFFNWVVFLEWSHVSSLYIFEISPMISFIVVSFEVGSRGTSSQEEGVGRYAASLHATTERIITKHQNK